MRVMADAERTGPPADQLEDRSVYIVRAWLFLSSYAPLFVILAIRFEGAALKTVCAVLAGIGFGYLFVVVFVVARRAQARDYPVASVQDASGEVAGYLATYLVPFVTVPSPSAADLAGYCILALVVLAIFLRSELARINPTLYLLGWRVASITTGQASYYIVCRRLPRPATGIRAVRVGGLLVRKEPPGDG
jgi:hypothetical protein